MSAIALRDVTAGYDGVAAIDGIRISVGAGEIVALLGANGAGKTTAIGAVCGLTQVLAGSIELEGVDVTLLGPRDRARRGLGAVLDDRGVFTQLTVAENLQVGGGRSAIGALFPELDALLDRQAGLLSGGEQTLLAVARALAGRPRALVVDELTTGLAPVLVESALGVLRRVATDWGTGVLLAEQSAHLALAAADRAYVLRRGRMVLEGSAGEIATRTDLLESTYLGEMA